MSELTQSPKLENGVMTVKGNWVLLDKQHLRLMKKMLKSPRETIKSITYTPSIPLERLEKK